MTAKFRCKIGDLEFEYEGDPAFLQDDLINLVGRAVDRFKDEATVPPTPAEKARPHGRTQNQSTNTIASLLTAKTGNDLAIAAGAHLSIIKRHDKFTRKELLDEMKGATTYYKGTYSNNLSATLDTLVKSRRFNLLSKDTYALGPAERQRLETQLAAQ